MNAHIQVLIEFAKTAPGRLPGRVQEAIAKLAASPLPQVREQAALPGVVTDSIPCEDCNGTGAQGEEYSCGEFQPPERDRCSSCDGSGRWKLAAAALTQGTSQAAATGGANEALRDLLWSNAAKPSCQAGVIARCMCNKCASERARAILAEAGIKEKT